jgi:hypothetical protein
VSPAGHDVVHDAAAGVEQCDDTVKPLCAWTGAVRPHPQGDPQGVAALLSLAAAWQLAGVCAASVIADSHSWPRRRRQGICLVGCLADMG